MSFLGLPERGIVELAAVEAFVEPGRWAYAEEQAEAIAAHWARLAADKPTIFNGRVLVQAAARIDAGVFRAAYVETDYAAFVHWLQVAVADRSARNGFAMAALKAADGAWLLGVMSGNTVNAGRVYFPAGTPDLNDVGEAGLVDLAGSLERELFEETGLEPGEVAVDPAWTAAIDGQRVGFLREVTVPLPAEAARQMILDRIADHADPELADIRIVRGLSDLDERAMPRFLVDYLRHKLSARPR